MPFSECLGEAYPPKLTGRGFRFLDVEPPPKWLLELSARCDRPVRDAVAAWGIAIIHVTGDTEAEGLLLERYSGTDDARGSRALSRWVMDELLCVTGWDEAAVEASQSAENDALWK